MIWAPSSWVARSKIRGACASLVVMSTWYTEPAVTMPIFSLLIHFQKTIASASSTCLSFCLAARSNT